MRHTSPMPSISLYHRHRFSAQIFSHCVWLYFRFALSFRDVEEMLAMRGVSLSYETVREWCLKFGQTYANGPTSQVTSTRRPMASRRSVPQDQMLSTTFDFLCGQDSYVAPSLDPQLAVSCDSARRHITP